MHIKTTTNKKELLNNKKTYINQQQLSEIHMYKSCSSKKKKNRKTTEKPVFLFFHFLAEIGFRYIYLGGIKWAINISVFEFWMWRDKNGQTMPPILNWYRWHTEDNTYRLKT